MQPPVILSLHVPANRVGRRCAQAGVGPHSAGSWRWNDPAAIQLRSCCSNTVSRPVLSDIGSFRPVASIAVLEEGRWRQIGL
jgi:hypothetical protein